VLAPPGRGWRFALDADAQLFGLLLKLLLVFLLTTLHLHHLLLQ
jgi:hypothetical protein